ncbi:Penicillin-binding protein 1A [Nymphaea thermarum]|nr:Penicillin-binding protein 1A [Nymphaea thermarum]
MLASYSFGVGAVRHSPPVRRRPYQSTSPQRPFPFSDPRPPSSLSLFFRPSLPTEMAPLPRCRAARSYSDLTRGDDWTLIWLIFRNALVVLVFASSLAVLRLLFSVVPSNFGSRWEALVREEATCPDAWDVPPYVWQAVVASEDRRFFRHRGVDPRGIARAVFSLATNGGGSTITQQLVKNVLLRSECRWARKVVEGLVSLCLEKKMSKWQILSAYLRKHPTSLSLGEAALLAGIIPSPEILSPFKDLNRGKRSQARALRRMVEAGYLDVETALWVIKQPICLHNDEPNQEKPKLPTLPFTSRVHGCARACVW